MKQVININFHGRVVPIEVTAFDKLKAYTDSLNRYFAAEEGKEEIINDIESRIGELFQERLKSGATCITDDDVDAIIRSMGRPEDFETSEAAAGETKFTERNTESSESTGNQYHAAPKRLYRDENDKVFGGVCSGLANYFGIDVVVMRIIFVILAVSFGFGLLPYLILWIAVPSTASKEIGGVRKKLYRDSDDKIIGGVCSGIGNYFGINPWIPRVLFLLPFLSFVTSWNHWDFPDLMRLTFSPGALIVYIILWLVIPEATTTTEKLEMKGEKVDLNSIKTTVMEEMKGFQHRAEKFGKEAKDVAEEKAKAFGSDVKSAATRSSRSLGDIIILLVKIFVYFILGVIGFSLVMSLFAIGIVSVGMFPIKDFILTDGWQNVYAWGTLIFFIAVPIIGVITWLIRKLARIKRNSKLMRLSFTGMWIIGWVFFMFLLASVTRDFKAGNTLNEEEVNLVSPAVNNLTITASSPEKKYYRNNWFNIRPYEIFDEDTVLVRNVSIHIVKAKNDSFRVTMLKMVNGNTRRYADTLASLIEFNAVQQDSLLLIDRGIPINRTDKFRNQRVILTVYVPVGKQIKIDNSVSKYGNIRFEGPWNDDDWNIEFDEKEHGWSRDVDYIMKEDGLYTLDGIPADSWKNNKIKIDNIKVDIKDGENRIQMDINNPSGNTDNYRYNDTPAGKMESDKKKLEQQRIKDSLQKAREDIDREIRKLGATEPVQEESVRVFYASSLMMYSPLKGLN